MQNNMKINSDKCATLTVCFMKNIPRLPHLHISTTDLQTVDCVKILGILIRSDLKWDKHADQIYRKATNKIYILKLLKHFHLSIQGLLTI